ncbi:MAG: hypothetical protein ACHQ01_05000 [Candidatus Limnocylindrales bacterium]
MQGRRTSAVATLAVCLILASGCSASPAASTTPAPSLPGTPGHFNDGQEAFDFPADWPVIAGGFSSGGVEYVLAVIGEGTWKEGCVYSASSTACSADTVKVPPGGVVVKVYRWWGGPLELCHGDTQANATFGNLAVRKRVDSAVTTWEIRVPGSEFGSNNNVFVEAHTTDSGQLAKAEALVGSFRWIGPQNGMCPSGAPTFGLVPS